MKGNLLLVVSALGCLIGCSESPKVIVAPPSSQAEVDAARTGRRAYDVSLGDPHFLVGHMERAATIFKAGVNDEDKSIRAMAKRKLASTYEVQGNEKESLKLLTELESENVGPISTDPLTSLKALYFAERTKNKSAFDKAMTSASTAQKKLFEVTHDPLVAPGSTSNLFYSLAIDAAEGTDWVLFDWAVNHAEKGGKLTNQHWLQIAATLSPENPTKATAICKRVEPKLTGEDKSLELHILQKMKDEADKKKAGEPNRQMDSFNLDSIPAVAKFKSTGYWLTGKVPKYRIMSMKIGRAR